MTRPPRIGRRTRVAAVGIALAIACAAPASAQPSKADVVAAQALFDQARALLARGAAGEACPKLERSQQLDPAPGTQFNLADCYERIGKLASAHALFVTVADAAKAAGKTEKEKIARDRAAALAPKLSRLTIAVDPTSRVPGLSLTRDGIALNDASLETAVPVDGGEHVVEASAPGKLAFRRVVSVEPGGNDVVVTVRLDDAAKPAAATPPPAEPARPDRPSPLGAQRIAAIGVGTLGLAGVAIGAVFGLQAIGKHDEAQSDHCPTPTRCTARGAELTDEAQTAATVSTIGFVAGGALLAAGAVLFVTAPSTARSPERTGFGIAPAVGPRAAGVAFDGRF